MDSDRTQPTVDEATPNASTLAPGGGSLELTNLTKPANLEPSRFTAGRPAVVEVSRLHLDFAAAAVAAGGEAAAEAAAAAAAGEAAASQPPAKPPSPWQHG